jgi:peptidoglycan/xylan/chitin deacetylase (PgdA/CDA1 family)
MIYIYINDACINEKKYILNVIFKCWLGLDYEIKFHEDENYKIILPNEAVILIPDLFLSMKDEEWLFEKTLPKSVVKKSFFDHDFLICSDIPHIFRDNTKEKEEKFSISLDIFGSIFYLISGYEESVIQTKDQHGRFDFKESLGYQHTFLDKPIVNEYLEILWHFLHKGCPLLQRKKRKYHFELSHDVDQPFFFLFMTLHILIREGGHAILREQSPYKALFYLVNYLTVKSGFIEKDRFYTFDWIMDLSEKYNIQSTFNFISGNHSPMDAQYRIHDPRISKLMERMSTRGHLIGLHGSYNSYNHYTLLKNEYDHLKQVMDKAHIKQDLESSRQHYLRWDSSVTPYLLNKVGLKYDTTLTHAGYPGFRCGTCYEFPMYDLKNRQELKLIQRPLVVMEASILEYLGLSYQDGVSRILSLANECKKFNGTFSLLWHNSELETKKKKELYSEVLSTAA